MPYFVSQFHEFFFCQLCVQWRCPAASRDDRNSIEIFDGGDAYSYAFWYLLSNWLFIIGLIPPPSQTHTVWPNLKFYLVILKKNYFHHADLFIWTHLFYYLLFALAKHTFKFCYRMSPAMLHLLYFGSLMTKHNPWNMYVLLIMRRQKMAAEKMNLISLIRSFSYVQNQGIYGKF